MALLLGVNSYATLNEAELYFEDRLDVAAWVNADEPTKTMGLVTATQQMDQFRYAGYAATDTQALAFPRRGSFMDSSRGRTLEFAIDYTFVELDTSDSTAFWTALIALPSDIQRLKKATFEQAYHLINSDGVLDTNRRSEDANSVSIGSISISGSHVSASGTDVPLRGRLAVEFITPLLEQGGRFNWFRAN